MSSNPAIDRVLTVPNVLSAVRFALALVLFVAIERAAWAAVVATVWSGLEYLVAARALVSGGRP